MPSQASFNNTTRAHVMSTALPDDAAAIIVERLGVILSSAAVLSLKAQGFHWNVTGPNFFSLHEMLGAQYAELHAASDEIAERIRALGASVPTGFAIFARRSAIADAPEAAPGAREMLATLKADHETLSQHCSELRRLADESGDTATGDLMNGRINAHDKAAWMLRAHLTNG